MNIQHVSEVVQVLSHALSLINEVEDEQDEVMEECKRTFTPLRISVFIDDAHCSGADDIVISVDQFHAVTVYREPSVAVVAHE